MERIMIIGCGGSGKTTLARIFGEKTGLPVIHLDQIFWSPGNWQHLEKPEFDARVLHEMERPRWIMDGNYGRTMLMRLEKCDTVIYLDYNRFVCIWGWLKRVIKNWGTARPDMGPKCNERLDLEFAKWHGHLTAKTVGNTTKYWHSTLKRKSTFSKTAVNSRPFCKC